ncbi:TPA: DUF2971 domain-containing protein, partial [Legionella pneumophila]|nr:DUF2971 domain-containing protein [Legionella pneumophila]
MVINIDSLLDKAKEKCHNAMSALAYWQDIPQTLYHFTTLSTLISILENKTIRFTHYKYLNDETELKFAMDGINQYITDNKVPNSHDHLKHLNKITAEINKRKNTYIFCLSKILDNLAMWRMYADDSFGVAIGFDRDINLTQGNKNLFTPFIGKVIYGIEYPDEIKDLINFVIETWNNETIREQLNDPSNTETRQNFDNSIATPIIMLSMINKHPSFKLEEEIRLLLFDGELAYPSTHPKGYYFPNNYRCAWSREIKQPD